MKQSLVVSIKKARYFQLVLFQLEMFMLCFALGSSFDLQQKKRTNTIY